MRVRRRMVGGQCNKAKQVRNDTEGHAVAKNSEKLYGRSSRVVSVISSSPSSTGFSRAAAFANFFLFFLAFFAIARFWPIPSVSSDIPILAR